MRGAVSLLCFLTVACGGIDVEEGDPDAGQAGDPDAGQEVIDLVDDLEDGNARILPNAGRVGFWYTLNDGTGTQDPAPSTPFIPTQGGANESTFSARTTGSKFSEWGAKVGFPLNHESEAAGPLAHDLSGATGLRFWARGNVPFRAVVVTTGVLDEAHGGACVQDPPNSCDDYHGTAVALSGEWQEYSLPFSEMEQVGWGQSIPRDLATAVGIEFEIAGNDPFDVAIDDVAFYTAAPVAAR